MKLKGNNHKERGNHQLDEWVKGNPIHNTIDEECCPDFSCCKPEFLQPLEVRETFKEVCKKESEEKFNPEHHPYNDAKMGMLMSFLGSAMSTAYSEKKIHIVGEGSEKIEQN